MIAKLEEPIGHISAGLIAMPIDLPGTKFNRAVGASKQIKKEIENIVLQKKIDLNNQLSSNLEHTARDLLSSLLMETYSNGEEMADEFDRMTYEMEVGI